MFSAEFDLEGLLDSFDQVDEELGRHIPVALKAAGDRIAAQAKETHEYTDRSGQLTNSIDAEQVAGSWSADNLEVSVAAGAPHAAAIEFGAKAHVIKPRYKKALRIPIEGGFRFAKGVQHPGNRPYRYLRNALEAVMPDAEEEVTAAVDLAFLNAGLG